MYLKFISLKTEKCSAVNEGENIWLKVKAANQAQQVNPQEKDAITIHRDKWD
jgi:hypothetical protein